MDELKKQINAYLFYEFGFDVEIHQPEISSNSPFTLKHLDTITVGGKPTEVFGFKDDQAYFAFEGNYQSQAGMDIRSLALQEKGSTWIQNQDPIALSSQVFTPGVPAEAERRQACTDLAKKAFPDHAEVLVLEGLWLTRRQEHWVLAGLPESKTAKVVSETIEPIEISFPDASTARRLSIGIGQLLEKGILD